MNTYINTVCLWLLDQSVKNHAKVGKNKLHFCVAATHWRSERLKFNSERCSSFLGSRFVAKQFLLVFNRNTVVALLAFLNL